jgi:hypothetical protein
VRRACSRAHYDALVVAVPNSGAASPVSGYRPGCGVDRALAARCGYATGPARACVRAAVCAALCAWQGPQGRHCYLAVMCRLIHGNALRSKQRPESPQLELVPPTCASPGRCGRSRPARRTGVCEGAGGDAREPGPRSAGSGHHGLRRGGGGTGRPQAAAAGGAPAARGRSGPEPARWGSAGPKASGRVRGALGLVCERACAQWAAPRREPRDAPRPRCLPQLQYRLPSTKPTLYLATHAHPPRVRVRLSSPPPSSSLSVYGSARLRVFAGPFPSMKMQRAVHLSSVQNTCSPVSERVFRPCPPPSLILGRVRASESRPLLERHATAPPDTHGPRAVQGRRARRRPECVPAKAAPPVTAECGRALRLRLSDARTRTAAERLWNRGWAAIGRGYGRAERAARSLIPRSGLAAGAACHRSPALNAARYPLRARPRYYTRPRPIRAHTHPSSPPSSPPPAPAPSSRRRPSRRRRRRPGPLPSRSCTHPATTRARCQQKFCKTINLKITVNLGQTPRREQRSHARVLHRRRRIGVISPAPLLLVQLRHRPAPDQGASEPSARFTGACWHLLLPPQTPQWRRRPPPSKGQQHRSPSRRLQALTAPRRPQSPSLPRRGPWRRRPGRHNPLWRAALSLRTRVWGQRPTADSLGKDHHWSAKPSGPDDPAVTSIRTRGGSGGSGIPAHLIAHGPAVARI